MQEESIIRSLLKNLNLTDTKVYKFTLTVSKEALAQRLNKDIFIGKRKPDVLERSIEIIPLYINMDTIHIDVSNISQVRAARLIFNSISKPAL
ncbi:MAG: hypothetical protein GXX11_04935 [Acholeplasmataceae bacterium]|nr:hypothetical protein [Acholeplasmataceae bacterium]